MPTLACRICGRIVYTTAALDNLFAEERRCPRCGHVLEQERRTSNRRKLERRQNPPDSPGGPGGVERRMGDRRVARRRRDDGKPFGSR
jgi:DNA-directed RNA polymerase subunit RPC12/RpoP